jgi:hypothetical protein
MKTNKTNKVILYLIINLNNIISLNEYVKMECSCNDETLTLDFTCEKCEQGPFTIKMPHHHRMMKCKIHKFIPICGVTSLICENCQKEGWYSTKGNGSSYWEFVNNRTGERIPGYKYIESEESF